MSVTHMAMVFAAEGLDGPEKLLLLAYANYTDAHGYCWPGEVRLADDCGTSVRTVQRVKTRLTKKKLLKSVRRKSKSGNPISNLSRINLPLLASMARKQGQYDDDLIGAITFDDDTQGDPEATLRGTPDEPETPSDLLTRHDDGYLPPSCQVPTAKMAGTYRQDGGQSVSDPVVDPVGNLSLSSVVAKAEGARGRAKAADERETTPTAHKPTTKLPAQRAAQPQEPTQPPATTAERIIRQAALVQPAEETAFIQWATARHQPRTPAWWRTVAKQGDLPELVAAWRSEAAQAVSQAAAVVVLPTWCGQCDGEEVPRRWREDDAGRAYRCPVCHPDAMPAAPVVSRQQQEVDDQFARQMARARARDAAREGMTITDQRVADGMALADRLAAEGNGGSSTSW